jgi:hypothetical protein
MTSPDPTGSNEIEHDDAQTIGMTSEDIDLFVDEFIGHSGGYLVPWSGHDEIVRVLRKADVREREWTEVRNNGEGTPGARSTMKRFLASLPPYKQAAVVEAISTSLKAGEWGRWSEPAFRGAEKDVEGILARLRDIPLPMEAPQDAWPDIQRKIEKAKSALADNDPWRAIEVLYPAAKAYADQLLREHEPPIRGNKNVELAITNLFNEHSSFAVDEEWQETVREIRDGLVLALGSANKVRSAGTDVHERGPSRPYDPSRPIPRPEAHLMAELLIIGINYMHRTVSANNQSRE